MVTTLLAIVALGGQSLLRDAKEIRLTDCTIYEVPANWRAPALAARKTANAASLERQFYIAFLKKRYGYQIAALNEAYGLGVSAFTELEASDFAQLDEKRAEVLADDLQFATESFTERVESAFKKPGNKFRLVEVPDQLPEAIVKALSSLAVVDGILVHGPVKGTTNKPVVLWNCPAVKPAFATACLRI